MKSFLLPAWLLVAAIGTPLHVTYAQDARAPAEVQKEYDGFLVDFRAALKANNAASVTKLTAFPFYWNEMRDAAYFEKNLYSQIFKPKIRRCLANAKGVYARDPSGRVTFSHFCGEALFLFARTPQGFRFIEAGVND